MHSQPRNSLIIPLRIDDAVNLSSAQPHRTTIRLRVTALKDVSESDCAHHDRGRQLNATDGLGEDVKERLTIHVTDRSLREDMVSRQFSHLLLALLVRSQHHIVEDPREDEQDD